MVAGSEWQPSNWCRKDEYAQLLCNYFNKHSVVRVECIHLDVVHAPLCEGPGVGLQVCQGAGVASAGPRAVVRINTELEPEFMDIVGQSLDARGEPGYKYKIDMMKSDNEL